MSRNIIGFMKRKFPPNIAKRRAEKIKEIDDKIRSLYIQRYYLIDTCRHNIIKTSAGDARCDICGTYFGWWCPKSSDHLCHYKEPDEWCIYCGQPEERK